MGGMEFWPLDVLSFRMGFASALGQEWKAGNHRKEEQGVPTIGASVQVPVGQFNIGTSLSLMRTSFMTTTSMRGLIHLVF